MLALSSLYRYDDHHEDDGSDHDHEEADDHEGASLLLSSLANSFSESSDNAIGFSSLYDLRLG